MSKKLIIRLEADEQWSFVQRKKNQRWLWWVEDFDSGQVVTFVFGRRTHRTFQQLRNLLKEHRIRVKKWFTDDWWAYLDLLNPRKNQTGKRNTQKLERKHLDLRTRIKRLARWTICFSKSETMHDTPLWAYISIPLSSD